MATADLDRLRGLLARLDALLVRQQAPIVHAWRPGVPTDEARARVRARAGLRLPVEAQVWFAWHDGVTPRRPAFRGSEFHFVSQDLELLSLDECIAEHLRLREMAVMLEHDDPIITADERWPATWFPLVRSLSGEMLLIDCKVPDGDAAPVHRYITHDLPRYSHEPKAASLADAVALWVEVLERGLCAYDPASGRWIKRREDFDERLRLSELV